MKVNNNQKGKHKEFEDKMNYDFHVKRMNEISFRQKRSQDNILGTSGNYKA